MFENISDGTLKGNAAKRVAENAEGSEEGIIFMPWGVGNHGGGPSEIDLNNIEKYIAEHPEADIKHSWCENYFDELDKSGLKKVEKSLVHCMVGCWSIRIMKNPWGMRNNGFYDLKGEFEVASAEEANAFIGYPDSGYENVRVIENGSVRAKVQAIMKNDHSFAVITYTIPKEDNYIDIKIKTFAQDVNVMYKLSFHTPFENSEFAGQTAFGREVLKNDGREVVYQKWCGLIENGKSLAMLNRGTYGGSASGGVMNISLLRTAVYSAHPISGDRPICDNSLNHDYIDLGEREFEYRLTTDIEKLDKNAEIYNQPCYALSFFPSGNGEKKETIVEIDNDAVILSAYKKCRDKKFIRVFNSSNKNQNATLKLPEKSFKLQLTPFEVKAFEVQKDKIKECNLIGDAL